MAQSSPTAADAKARAAAAVEARAEQLIDISHRIHENPELGFEEHFAHDLLAGAAEEAGLAVQRQAYGLETAFAARAGSSGPQVAILCEYDALPGIGHACGHNIIAASGLGAGLAAAEVVEGLGGRLLILGTPAEEGGGGKVRLIDGGAFDGVDAAIMLHPAGLELAAMQTLAVQQLRARYTGSAAHAAAAPQAGRNALDGAVLGYMAAAALRQHIAPDERLHGIFTDGGQKPNIVPAYAETNWYARSPTRAQLEALKERLSACLAGGAAAAGVDLQLDWADYSFAEVRSNAPLVELWCANAATLGRRPQPPAPGRTVMGSTDMGNVSQIVPSIHPMIAVAPPEVAIHTESFAAYARSASGDRGVIDGAKTLAAVAIDFWDDESVRAAAAADFAGGPVAAAAG
ncbi:MAG: amidohydrolase [bacterium]|nr:amidohydrolase [bacterium]MCY3925737.1 amidohydrolase [bacterium]